MRRIKRFVHQEAKVAILSPVESFGIGSILFPFFFTRFIDQQVSNDEGLTIPINVIFTTIALTFTASVDSSPAT